MFATDEAETDVMSPAARKSLEQIAARLDRMEQVVSRLDRIEQVVARLDRLEQKLGEIRSLVGPFGLPFDDGSLLVQTLYGNKYFIDPTDLIMAPQLVVYRQWEPDISHYMLASTGPDTVFVDVGANFGYFSILAASRIGRSGSGRVIAVEPNPRMLRLLEKNLQVNWSMGPVDVHRCAVSETPGYVRFQVPANAANASIAASGNDRDGSFIVQTRSIDEITGGRPVDIMKIDVEGFEIFALRGAMQTIRNSPSLQIIMEWSPDQMKQSGQSVEALLSVIREAGLSAYQIPASRHLSEAQWAALHLPEESLLTSGYANLLLRKPS